VNAAVRVRGPAGECFYTAGKPERRLVLVGVGSGLAPLWGILRDALAAGHSGPIQLWHAARSPERLYLRAELARLASRYPNLTYHPCALEPGLDDATEHAAKIGPVDELLTASGTVFAGSAIFLCGDAEIVQRLRRKVFLLGAALPDIHADAFVSAAQT
jgi:ferredoxin-NADP reductase